jgi:hypothetical protein
MLTDGDVAASLEVAAVLVLHSNEGVDDRR